MLIACIHRRNITLYHTAPVSKMAFTQAQKIVLAVLPKISGWTSMVFSFLIVYTVLKDPKRRSKPYHRLVCGISITDFSASFWLALSTWPIPRDSGVLWASGTTTTCNLQGFFTQAGIASSFYNCSLSIYFLLVIKCGWKESQIRKIEPCLHGVPIAWALLSASTGLGLGAFGNANLWCWVKSTNEVFRWAAFYGPLWMMIAIISIICVLILLHVRRIEIATDRRRRHTMLEYSATQQPTSSSQFQLGAAGEPDKQADDKNADDQTSKSMEVVNLEVLEGGDEIYIDDNRYVTEEVYNDVVLSRTSHIVDEEDHHVMPASMDLAERRERRSIRRERLSNQREGGSPIELAKFPSDSPSTELGFRLRRSTRRRAVQQLAKDQQSLKRTRQVARQSFLFAGAFYLNWIALSVSASLQSFCRCRRGWTRVNCSSHS